MIVIYPYLLLLSLAPESILVIKVLEHPPLMWVQILPLVTAKLIPNLAVTLGLAQLT